MDFKNRLPIAALLFSIVVIPLAVHPYRYDSYEGYRTGLMLMMTLLTLPFTFNIWSRADQMGKIMLGVCAAWAGWMAVTTVFAPTVYRAFYGDITRQMGLFTNLVIMSAIFLGYWVVSARAWRWFWLVGIIAAVEIMIESQQDINIVFGRPKGVIGWTTFTGPWLMLVVLWGSVGVYIYEFPQLGRNSRLLYGLGVMVMAMGMFFLAARAAIIGTGVGLITAGLAWAAVNARRRIALVASAIAIAGMVVLILLSSVDWQQTQFKDNPLLSRIKVDTFRQSVWDDTLTVVKHWPTIYTVEGEPDRWEKWRPLFGYGMDGYEFPFLPFTGADFLNQQNSIDRAHNDTLDAIVMLGWPGLILRMALWYGAIWLAMYRLGLTDQRGVGIITLAALIAGYLFRDSVFIALAVVLATIIGLWLWLLAQAFITDQNEKHVVDKKGVLGLTILTAHLVGLQFNFSIVSTDWIVWFTIGMLLTPQEAVLSVAKGKKTILSDQPYLAWVLVGLGAAVLIRGLSMEVPTIKAIHLAIMIVSGAIAAAVIAPYTWRGLVGMVLLVLFGAIGRDMNTPDLSALWDLLLIFFGMLLLSYDVTAKYIELPPLKVTPQWAYLVIIAIGGYYLYQDIRSDVYMENGLENPVLLERVQDLDKAQNLIPIDDVLALEYLRAVMLVGISESNAEWAARIPETMENAEKLNKFDATLAFYKAAWYLQLADTDTANTAAHNEQAGKYLSVAAQLSPNNSLVWREWARYMWLRQNEPAKAYGMLQTAQELNGNDPDTQNMITQLVATNPGVVEAQVTPVTSP